MKPKVLFLCTGNSCRSQMAEGWAKNLLSDQVESFSAGTDPHPLNLNAVKVMEEVGIDISFHFSKTLQSFEGVDLDLIVTVCDDAAQSCPIPPSSVKVIHVPFDDPPRLAKDSASEEEALLQYRRVRDEIKAFVLTLPTILGIAK